MQRRNVALYGRVSTEHLEQLSALRNQMDWYKSIVDMHPEWRVVEEYIDEGITGTSAKKRPAFQKMIKDAECKKFDLIVTREVCRFARNTVDTLVYTRKLKAMGVEVFFVNDNIWTCDGDGELRLTIMATMAQEESRKTSERVNAGLKTSQEKGVLRGAKILGYNKVNRSYIIDDEEAKTVVMIYNWYKEGYGYKAIARMLEEKGRLTAYKKTRWHSANIAKILSNPFYIGYQVQNQTKSDGYLTQKKVKQDKEAFTYVKGDYPLFLDESLFYICQKSREERKIILDDNSIVGKQIHQSIWVKKLECECGSKFRRVKWSYSKKRREYSYGYQCYRQLNYGKKEKRKERNMDTHDTCGNKGFAEWKVELATYSAISEFYGSSADTLIEKVVKVVDRYYVEEEPEMPNESDLDNLKEKHEKLKKRLQNYTEMRADGEISKEEYIIYKNQCQEQIEILQKEILNIESSHNLSVNEKEEVLENIREFLKLLFEFKPDKEQKYDDEFLDVIIKKIVARNDNIFDIYFNSYDNEVYKRRICGNIYHSGVEIPTAGNTNRGSCKRGQILRNALKSRFLEMVKHQ